MAPTSTGWNRIHNNQIIGGIRISVGEPLLEQGRVQTQAKQKKNNKEMEKRKRKERPSFLIAKEERGDGGKGPIELGHREIPVTRI